MAANVNGSVGVKPDARTLTLRRRLVYWAVSVVAALVVGWPAIADGHSLQCGLISTGAIALLFAALIYLGESQGVSRWLWGTVATFLSFGAPLSTELCLTDGKHSWWIGLGFAFFALTALIAWRSRRNTDSRIART